VFRHSRTRCNLKRTCVTDLASDWSDSLDLDLD
jgi:hypothetical protein